MNLFEEFDDELSSIQKEKDELLKKEAELKNKLALAIGQTIMSEFKIQSKSDFIEWVNSVKQNNLTKETTNKTNKTNDASNTAYIEKMKSKLINITQIINQKNLKKKNISMQMAKQPYFVSSALKLAERMVAKPNNYKLTEIIKTEQSLTLILYVIIPNVPIDRKLEAIAARDKSAKFIIAINENNKKLYYHRDEKFMESQSFHDYTYLENKMQSFLFDYDTARRFKEAFLREDPNIDVTIEYVNPDVVSVMKKYNKS